MLTVEYSSIQSNRSIRPDARSRDKFVRVGEDPRFRDSQGDYTVQPAIWKTD